jgi:hypothetical protein
MRDAIKRWLTGGGVCIDLTRGRGDLPAFKQGMTIGPGESAGVELPTDLSEELNTLSQKGHKIGFIQGQTVSKGEERYSCEVRILVDGSTYASLDVSWTNSEPDPPESGSLKQI